MPEKRYKTQILTIPNLLSLLRIVTIVPLVLCCLSPGKSLAAAAFLAFGVMTDVADGFIARRFSMTSALGKALDPIADKLLQGAVLLCLLPQHRQMLALAVLFAVKEAYIGFCAWLALHYCHRLDPAPWFSKLSSTALYLACGLLLAFPSLPLAVVDSLIWLCFALLVLSAVLYTRHFHAILRDELSTDPAIRRTIRRTVTILLALVWLVILGLCFYYRRLIRVETIVAWSPHSVPLAVLLLLLLFALKSVSFFLYCGIFYAASGILFPLPLAIAVNVLGTAVMALFPYFLGRTLGSETIDRLVSRKKSVRKLRDMQRGNNFLFVYLARACRLSYDVVSLLMGALSVPFRTYLPASILGMLVPIVTYPIIGMSLSDPASPMFRLSLLAEAILAVAAVVVWRVYQRRRAKN